MKPPSIEKEGTGMRQPIKPLHRNVNRSTTPTTFEISGNSRRPQRVRTVYIPLLQTEPTIAFPTGLFEFLSFTTKTPLSLRSVGFSEVSANGRHFNRLGLCRPTLDRRVRYRGDRQRLEAGRLLIYLQHLPGREVALTQ